MAFNLLPLKPIAGSNPASHITLYFKFTMNFTEEQRIMRISCGLGRVLAFGLCSILVTIKRSGGAISWA